MSPKPLKLLVITASVRQGRFGPVVASWFLHHAKQSERFDTELLDLAEHSLPSSLPDSMDALADTLGRDPAMRALAQKLDDAEAFVIVTPEYNHSFPASIKQLIDWHFNSWKTKPVAFVSYGGVSGGLRAVEQLRLVLAEMHATTIRDTVSFDRYWEKFNENGELNDGIEADTAAEKMIAQLSWWALTLRYGRNQLPYQ
jgi:NAD(P)H-dependent FMN reductase